MYFGIAFGRSETIGPSIEKLEFFGLLDTPAIRSSVNNAKNIPF